MSLNATFTFAYEAKEMQRLGSRRPTRLGRRDNSLSVGKPLRTAAMPNDSKPSKCCSRACDFGVNVKHHRINQRAQFLVRDKVGAHKIPARPSGSDRDSFGRQQTVFDVAVEGDTGVAGRRKNAKLL